MALHTRAQNLLQTAGLGAFLMEGDSIRVAMARALVPVPLELWAASLILDLLYMSSSRESLALASCYCLTTGIIVSLITTPFSWRERRTRAFCAEIVALGFFAGSLLLRRGGVSVGLSLMLSIGGALLLLAFRGEEGEWAVASVQTTPGIAAAEPTPSRDAA